jgi:hypothetical protein
MEDMSATRLIPSPTSSALSQLTLTSVERDALRATAIRLGVSSEELAGSLFYLLSREPQVPVAAPEEAVEEFPVAVDPPTQIIDMTVPDPLTGETVQILKPRSVQ